MDVNAMIETIVGGVKGGARRKGRKPFSDESDLIERETAVEIGMKPVSDCLAPTYGSFRVEKAC